VPYARNADLPAQVRNPLPDAAQTQFRLVVNSQLNRGLDDTRAFASAWAAVGRQYKKPKGGEGKWVHKRNGTLYAKRYLENADAVIKHAKSQGFAKTQVPSSMHATIAYSKDAVNWPEPDDDSIVVRSPGGRSVAPLGDGGAVVLKFNSPSMQRRWQSLCKDHGCSWDYEGFQPHVTLTWDAGDLDLGSVQPYTGDLVFGPEVFEPINEDWKDSAPTEKAADVTLLKYDSKLGLVFGWAIICKTNGVDYYDLQGDHIPEDAMLEASADFMAGDRTMKLMHKGKSRGTVLFAWPLTAETAKAMGVRTNTTGLMIAVKPEGTKIIDAIEAGELTGFSIGGYRIDDEEVS
jgi:cation transport regulator ChaB